MKNLILTTDTLHHKFFLKNIINLAKTVIIYETKKPKFRYKTFHKYKNQEYKYEKKFFFENNVPFFDTKKFKDLNHKKSIEFIKKGKFDNIFCFGIGKLKSNFLLAFKNTKILNFHGGNPCFYRGLDSLLWSIYKNDFKNLITTLHYVNKDLDTGDIIFKKKIRFNKNHNIYQLRSLNTLNIIELYKKFLKQKNIKPIKQKKIGTYYSAFPASKIKKCIYNIKNYAN